MAGSAFLSEQDKDLRYKHHNTGYNSDLKKKQLQQGLGDGI